MRRRTLLGLVAAVGSGAGCLTSHPLPPVRGRVVRTSVVGVRDGSETVLLRATPEAVEDAAAMRAARAAAAGSDASAPPAPLNVTSGVSGELSRRFDAVRYYLTVDHESRVRLYGVAPGESLRYRARPEVFREVLPGDRVLFAIGPGGSPRFKNATTIFRTGTVTRKRLRVVSETSTSCGGALCLGTDTDVRTVFAVTPDGVRRDGGPDVSLPLSEARLTELRDRFDGARLSVAVDHDVGGRTVTRTYRADRAPFNRLPLGDPTAFAVETVEDGSRVSALDPDSPFYADQPW